MRPERVMQAFVGGITPLEKAMREKAARELKQESGGKTCQSCVYLLWLGKTGNCARPIQSYEDDLYRNEKIQVSSNPKVFRADAVGCKSWRGR